jgi:hypothetical protein
MNNNAFDRKNDVEIYDLSKSFTDLNKDNRRGILKTAKNLLKVQNDSGVVNGEKVNEKEFLK